MRSDPLQDVREEFFEKCSSVPLSCNLLTQHALWLETKMIFQSGTVSLVMDDDDDVVVKKRKTVKLQPAIDSDEEDDRVDMEASFFF